MRAQLVTWLGSSTLDHALRLVAAHPPDTVGACEATDVWEAARLDEICSALAAKGVEDDSGALAQAVLALAIWQEMPGANGALAPVGPSGRGESRRLATT